MSGANGKIIVCIILVSLGVLAWIITIGARISSRRTGHYVSGIPAVGGILVAAGFLFSPIKWLALIGLLDFDLWYLIINVVAAIINGDRYFRDYVPPEEVDGGKVVEYSDYNKQFEELHIPCEHGATAIHRISRYIIVSRNGSYELLKTEINTRIVERVKCRSVDECRHHASPKARWISPEPHSKEE